MNGILSYCEAAIIEFLINNKFKNQRDLASDIGYSLGAVNKAFKNLKALGYIDDDNRLENRATSLIESLKPKNAIILAAGGGMRMVPINTITPKALLEVHGETLIERQIKQLKAVGVKDIKVVVGFMKERLEYIIDEYDVEFVVNTEYASKENLHSLSLVSEYLDNTYIVPCDVWCEQNPFNEREYFSWYMVSNDKDSRSDIRINRNMDLISVGAQGGNKKLGISYLAGKDAKKIKSNINKLAKDLRCDDMHWEEALFDEHKHRYFIKGREADAEKNVGINTYEQLRAFDSGSKSLDTSAINIIKDVFKIPSEEIKDIAILKKGMTNRSFLFTCKGNRYIMRIPGEGTDKLINREDEAAVYEAIRDKGLCDNPIYINPRNGYKITEYLRDVRNCDAGSLADVEMCIDKLREFHNMNLKVKHRFDIFEQLEFYESLWQGRPSIYRDYSVTKERVLSLKPFIEKNVDRICLTHIDAVPDNFLIRNSNDVSSDGSSIQLIDWEYSGMQDPHVDIAMFAIYSMYDKEKIDWLIDLYFEGNVSDNIRAKIYAYVSLCGLLWSNWSEYKSSLGIEFGKYSLLQYRYAKKYYRYASEIISREEA